MRVVHFAAQIDHTITIGIGITHVFLFRDVVILLWSHRRAMRRRTPIAKRLIPAMFFTCVIGAVLIGLVVRLVVGVHFLVEIIVTRLMVEDTAHCEFGDQLGVVIPVCGIITTTGSSHFDHRL